MKGCGEASKSEHGYFIRICGEPTLYELNEETGERTPCKTFYCKKCVNAVDSVQGDKK